MIDFEKCCGKAVVGGAKGVIIGSAAGTLLGNIFRSGHFNRRCCRRRCYRSCTRTFH